MGLFSTAETNSPNGGDKPLEGGAASRIAAASEQVKQKNLGGRPRKDGLPNKSGVGGAPVGKPSPGSAQPVQAPASEADIEFARTVAEAGLKILSKTENRIITGMIESIGDPYLLEKRDAYLRQCEIGEGDVELVTNAAGALAAKYSFLTRYAPEAALISWAAIHAMAFQGVTADLKRVAKEIAALKAKPSSASPS
jgi:hypothetical protein